MNASKSLLRTRGTKIWAQGRGMGWDGTAGFVYHEECDRHQSPESTSPRLEGGAPDWPQAKPVQPPPNPGAHQSHASNGAMDENGSTTIEPADN